MLGVTVMEAAAARAQHEHIHRRFKKRGKAIKYTPRVAEADAMHSGAAAPPSKLCTGFKPKIRRSIQTTIEVVAAKEKASAQKATHCSFA